MHPTVEPRGRSHAVAVLLAGLVAVIAGTCAWVGGLASTIEEDTVALRFRTQAAIPPSDVAVIAIDDATFSDLDERWPFPRRLHANAIDELRRLGARNVVYDVQFTEPTTERDDYALFDAIAKFPGTVLATTATNGHGGTDVIGGDAGLAKVGARAAMANFPTLAGGEIAHVLAEWDGLPTLAVAGAEAAGHKVDRQRFEDGKAWVSYRGPPGTIPTASFSDLIRGHVDPALIRGRTVVVGATAPTLQDVHATPVTRNGLMAGPEVQANAIWTVMHGLPLRTAPWWASLLAVLALALGPPLAALRMRALSAMLAPVLAAGYAGVIVVAFHKGYVLPAVGPGLALAISTVVTVTLSYLTERRERRIVARANAVLEQAVRERTAELRDTQLEVVRRLALAAEWRDADTGDHIERMSVLCHRLGIAAGMSADEAEVLRHAAVLHDVGKIGIPDRVLLKPGALDAQEWQIMQGHAEMGASILGDSTSPIVRMAEVVARTHHERWDGTGYPQGLSGFEIPLVGRVCSICDVFDALLSPRPYKEAWSLSDALAELRAGSGTHFDPQLLDLFLAMAPQLAAELHEAIQSGALAHARVSSSSASSPVTVDEPAAA